MGKLLTGSIDLSKIDESKLFKSDKTGKSYLNISVWINDEKDNYGNIASIQQSTKKDEPKIFIGNLKPYERIETVTAEELPTAPPAVDGGNDLPF